MQDTLKEKNFRGKKLSRFANFGQIRESYFREKKMIRESFFLAKKYEKQWIREIFQVFGLKLEGIIEGINIDSVLTSLYTDKHDIFL